MLGPLSSRSKAHRGGIRRHAHRNSGGVTLLELLVGMAVGLLVLSIASQLFLSNLRDARKTLMQARLTQDMRTTMELIVRDLRRSGYWRNALAARADPLHPVTNPYSGLNVQKESLNFAYNRDPTAVDSLNPKTEQFGFRLGPAPHSIQLLVGGGWQSLTNPETMKITPGDFKISVNGIPWDAGTPCSSKCKEIEGNLRGCPEASAPILEVVFAASAKADPSIARTLTSQVYLRNNVVLGQCSSG